MAVFEEEGKMYAVPIGSKSGDSIRSTDEMFFIQDPRELYRHWPRGYLGVDRETSK